MKKKKKLIRMRYGFGCKREQTKDEESANMSFSSNVGGQFRISLTSELTEC